MRISGRARREPWMLDCEILDPSFIALADREHGGSGSMWSTQVLTKYWALQVAGWIAVFVAAWFAAELFDWPKKVVWIIVVVWAAKDVLLYPLVWRAYEHHDSHASAYPKEGAEGVALQRLDPEGAVRVAGERWKAV